MLSLQRRRTEARFYSRRGNGAELRSKDSIFLHCKEDTIISCGKTIVHWAFQTKHSLFKEPTFQLSEIRNKYFRRLCYGIWLFYLHNALKIQPFSPVFPLAGSTAEAFFRLSLWSFKEKSINHFLWHSLKKQYRL